MIEHPLESCEDAATPASLEAGATEAPTLQTPEYMLTRMHDNDKYALELFFKTFIDSIFII